MLEQLKSNKYKQLIKASPTFDSFLKSGDGLVKHLHDSNPEFLKEVYTNVKFHPDFNFHKQTLLYPQVSSLSYFFSDFRLAQSAMLSGDDLWKMRAINGKEYSYIGCKEYGHFKGDIFFSLYGELKDDYLDIRKPDYHFFLLKRDNAYIFCVQSDDFLDQQWLAIVEPVNIKGVIYA